MLNVRDANNGRLLWKLKGARVFAGTPDGHLFLRHKGKLKICHAKTGSTKAEIKDKLFYDKIRSGKSYATDKVILWNAKEYRAYSTTGKRLWSARSGHRYNIGNKYLIISTYNSIKAINLETGKGAWNNTTLGKKIWGIKCVGKSIYAYSPSIYMKLDTDSGKLLWRKVNGSKKPFKSKVVFQEDKVFAMNYAPYHKKDSDLFITTLDGATGKTIAEKRGTKVKQPVNMCAPIVYSAGKYIFHLFNTWIDPVTMKCTTKYFAHPSCFFGTYLKNGLAYNFPSRKAGPLQGITALAPADMTFTNDPSGKLFFKYADTPKNNELIKPTDWPMFRNNTRRSNSTKANPGAKFSKLWEIDLSKSKKSFGELNSIRSGLTQVVTAFGISIVADMDGKRIVAFDSQTGETKWIFFVGNRTEFSPTLYKGLCLFTAQDGFVYCLNAKTGELCWKRLIPPQIRLIGGQEGLETLWPVRSDVMINHGVGYACAGLKGNLMGGIYSIAFKPKTGELIWSQCYKKGRGLGGLFSSLGQKGRVFMHQSSVDTKTGKRTFLGRGRAIKNCFISRQPYDDYLAGGVSLPRNGEDRGEITLTNGIVKGKTIAFDKELSVSYYGAISREKWELGFTSLVAKVKKGKENLWKIGGDLIVDDIIITPEHVYIVGHHYKEAKPPELRIISKKDGTILETHPLNNTVYPAWNGMSVADNKIFITTGEGKLICFQAK